MTVLQVMQYIAMTPLFIDLCPWVFWYFRSLEDSTSQKMPSSKYVHSERVYSIIEELEKEWREMKNKEKQSFFFFSYICGNPVKLISTQFSQCVLQYTFHFPVELLALARTIVKIPQKITMWIWSTYYWRGIQYQKTKTNLLNPGTDKFNLVYFCWFRVFVSLSDKWYIF